MMRQPEKQARAEAMLGELAELGLMVAKELAVRLRECEDTEETVALAGAFQKMSRVVRLTLALDFKLDRDAAREDGAEAQEAAAAARLDEAALDPDFLTMPIETLTRRLIADMGLRGELKLSVCEPAPAPQPALADTG